MFYATGIWFGILRGISAIAVISNVSTIWIFCVLHWDRTGHLIPFYTTKTWQEFQILNDTMIDSLHWAPDKKCLYAYLIYSLYNLISTAVLQYFIKFNVILIIFNQINLAFVRFNQNKSNINLLKISFAFIFFGRLLSSPLLRSLFLSWCTCMDTVRIRLYPDILTSVYPSSKSSTLPPRVFQMTPKWKSLEM